MGVILAPTFRHDSTVALLGPRYGKIVNVPVLHFLIN